MENKKRSQKTSIEAHSLDTEVARAEKAEMDQISAYIKKICPSFFEIVLREGIKVMLISEYNFYSVRLQSGSLIHPLLEGHFNERGKFVTSSRITELGILRKLKAFKDSILRNED